MNDNNKKFIVLLKLGLSLKKNNPETQREGGVASCKVFKEEREKF